MARATDRLESAMNAMDMSKPPSEDFTPNTPHGRNVVRASDRPVRGGNGITVDGEPFDDYVQLPPLKNEAEFRQLQRVLKEKGEAQLGPDVYRRNMARLRAYVQANPDILKPTEQKPTFPIPEDQREVIDNAQLTDDEPTFFDDFMRRSAGAGRAITQVLNSAIAEPSVGVRGLYEMVSTGGDEYQANKVMDEWRDMLTFVDSTPESEELLQTIAVPLAKLDEGAKELAYDVSFGNELAATYIYTSIMGGFEVAGLKGARGLQNAPVTTVSRSGPRLSIKTKPGVKEAEKVLETLQISPKSQTMPSDIVAAAQRMTPETRAANAEALQAALKKTNAEQKAALENKRVNARENKAYLDATETSTFAPTLRKKLIDEGWDLGAMPTALRRLKQIQGLTKGGPQVKGPVPTESPIITLKPKTKAELQAEVAPKPRKVELQRWVTQRNRLEKDILSARHDPKAPVTTNEKTVLERIAKEMDDALDSQFNKDMIEGDASTVSSWKEYEGARKQFVKNFDENKVISDLINKEATPEQIKRWVMGANSVGATPQMAKTMDRLKQLLGKDHPAIEGVRQDLKFDIMEPLMTDPPNLNQFIKNVDNIVRRRPEVLKALDISPGDLMPLRNAAKVSLKHPPSKIIHLVSDYYKAFTRFTIGHAIARAGAKVSLITNIIKKMTGADQASMKRLLYDFAEAQYGGPIINRGSVAASRAIQAAFYADYGHMVKDNEEVE